MSKIEDFMLPWQHILHDSISYQKFFTAGKKPLQSERTMRASLTSKSRFQTWNFPKRSMGWSLKVPVKICIFEEIREAIFQLSVEHSIFHLEFMSVVAALLLFKTCSSYCSGFGMSSGQKAYTFQLLPYQN